VLQAVHDPIIKFIAASHSTRNIKVTPAQVILLWTFQKGWIAIPRSSNKERLQENFDSLNLEPLTFEEIKLIDTLQYLISSPISVPIASKDEL
jgi:diketogulonate reductase-like aldo/keto reductase